MPSFIRPFVGRTLHKSGGVFGAQVKVNEFSRLAPWNADFRAHFGPGKKALPVATIKALTLFNVSSQNFERICRI